MSTQTGGSNFASIGGSNSESVKVITGSFNFTKAAEERNAENLLIIKSEVLAKKYLDNWNRHRDHSEVYEPKY